MDKKYPNDIRHRASELFESGHGYKATATILGLPTATVRVMLENNERFIWSRKTSLLIETYRRFSGSEASARYSTNRVMSGLQSSDLFVRLPFQIISDSHEYPVYKLVPKLDFELI